MFGHLRHRFRPVWFRRGFPLRPSTRGVRALRHIAREQSGITLVVATGVLGALSLAGGTVVAISSTNARSAEYSSSNGSVYSLAEAGMNMARATLWQASDPRSANAVPQQTVAMEGGTVTYSGTYSSATSTWTLTGTAALPNPTGAAQTTRTVSSKVLVSSSVSPVWQQSFADSTTSCMQIANNAVLSAPLYVRGDLCLNNNARFTGSSLHVGGRLTVNNNASVGTAATPIASANLVGGCTGGVPNPHSCSPTDRVYAQSITQTPGTLTKPSVDLDYWYQNASPGPMHGCTIGMPGGFDVDTTRNSNRPTFDLTPATSYDCQTTSGRLSWTPGNPGTLTVAGTIYFDGNIRMSNNARAVYQGTATLYSSAEIELQNNARLCGVAACDATWNPSVNNLLFVAGHPTSTHGFRIQNNAVFQGGAYVVSDYELSNNGVNWGPVVADEIKISNNAGQTIPLTSLPPGAPRADVTTLTEVPGSFTG